MTRTCWTLAGLALGALAVLGRAAEPLELEISAQSTNAVAEYTEATRIVTDPSGVIVRYGDAVLVAERIRHDPQTAEVQAEGNVELRRGKEVWRSERLSYNFETRQMGAADFRTGLVPFFAAGEGLHADLTRQTHSATNAYFTTDDVTNPGYRVRAKRLVFVPGRYIEAHQAVLYVGNIPVMYLPKYRRSLERHPNNFAFLPGYRSLYGPYLLGTYNWFLSTNADAAIHFDYRLKRGFGGGPDLRYDLGPVGQGVLRTYAAHDDEPGVDPYNNPIEPDRYRIGFLHSAFPRTNLSVKVVVNAESDPYVRRDFYESEYRKDVAPKTFAEVDQLWPNFTLNLLAQPRVNDFLQSVERLPDVKLTALRQQLGISPFYYESESSGAYLRLLGAESYLPTNYLATNHSALRADTYHQLLLPETLFGWLNVTPRIGGRFTYYADEEGAGLTADEQHRWVFNTGAEVSTKASRLWPEAHSSTFEVNGLRHIIEPSLNYVYVPSPTVRPSDLPQFDYEWYSYTLLPVDFPDYNSIDSIDSQNVIRLGLHNKLQTKRKEGLDNLVNWALVMDWRLRPRPGQSTFSDAYSNLDFKPRSWLTLNSEVRYSINDNLLRMANHTITLEPNETWAWRFGHRYLRELEGLGPGSGNNLLLSSFSLRLNENWGVRLRHHYDIENRIMQEQYYTVYRDFRSWTAALTLRLRDNVLGQNDFTIAVMISLKAFPRLKLNQDRDEPSLLLGG